MTVLWLGLPAVIGITLIFGIVRKELTILTLAVIFHTTNFASIMSPVQLDRPCPGLDALHPLHLHDPWLASEFGWKRALAISVSEIVMAIASAGSRSGCSAWRCETRPGRRQLICLI